MVTSKLELDPASSCGIALAGTEASISPGLRLACGDVPKQDARHRHASKTTRIKSISQSSTTFAERSKGENLIDDLTKD